MRTFLALLMAASAWQTCSAETTNCTDLVPAAKKDSKLVWYTGENTNITKSIAAAFEQKYGISVEINRSGTQQVANQFLKEAGAGIHNGDAITVFNLSILTDMSSRGLLARFVPSIASKLDPRFRDPEGYWVATNADLYIIAYNTDKIKGAEVPHSWKDLLSDKWRGKLVMGSPLYSGTVFQGTAGLVKLYGWDYFERLAKLHPLIVQSVLNTANPIVSGEREVGLSSDQFTRETAKKGNPIGISIPADGPIFVPAGLAVAKDAPHPNAARLWACFYLSDQVQQMLAQYGYYPVMPGVSLDQGKKSLAEQKNLVIVDPATVLKESSEVNKKFQTLFGG